MSVNIITENQTHAIQGMQEIVGERDGGIVIQPLAAAHTHIHTCVCVCVCRLHSAQTVSRTHLAFYSMRTGDRLGVNGWNVKLTTDFHTLP